MEEEEGVDPTLHAIPGPDPVVVTDTGSSPFLMSPIPDPPSLDPPSFDYMPMDQDPALALMLEELLDTDPISHSTPPASPTAPPLSTPTPPHLSVPPASPTALSTPTPTGPPLPAPPLAPLSPSLPGPANSSAPNKGGKPPADPMSAAEVQLVAELFKNKDITVALVRQTAKDNEDFKVIFDRKYNRVLLDYRKKIAKSEIERKVTKSLKFIVSKL